MRLYLIYFEWQHHGAYLWTINEMETPNTSSIQSNKQQSCRSCLYTGVATCLGLSSYFFYLATEDDMQKTSNDMKQQNSTVDKSSMKPTSQSKPIRSNNSTATNIRSKSQSSPKIHKSFQSQLNNFMYSKPIPKNNRPFLFAMSAVWAVAGAYRLYLN